MIYPIFSQNFPIKKFSKEKVLFICDCGNLFRSSWSDYQSEKIKSCGVCKLFLFKKNNIIKFNHLNLLKPINEINKLTEKVLWKCDCGSTKLIKLTNVINNLTISCGCANKSSKTTTKHLEITKEEWLKTYPQLLDINLPHHWSQGINQKFWFKCECGNHYERKFNRFSIKSTCRNCRQVKLSPNQVINNFIFIDQETHVNSDSTKKFAFVCPCGKHASLSLREVYSGHRKTCGNCNSVSLSTTEKFGRLTIKEPIEVSQYSDQKLIWVCDCGNESEHAAHAVLNGLTKSCGNCRSHIHSWYLENREKIKSLKCPIQPGLILGGIETKELIWNNDLPFKAICPVCKCYYYPRLSTIKKGESLTCGCISNITSLGQKEIANFVNSLGIQTKLEHSEFGYQYDILIPSHKLLIEYNGLRWHSLPGSKRRDIDKYKKAVSNYDYLMIFEDEWKYKKDCMKDIIENRLKIRKPSEKLRPKQCEIKVVPIQEANQFFDDYHYIGKCKSKINYGAYHDNKLLACLSFKKPTRKSDHDYELIRMVADPNYHIHGIWSKMLIYFMTEYECQSIVSFSDNRLFSGGVYKKLGFKFDGDVASDYYWWKNKRRYHKSGLRKPKGEVKTETEIRTQEGYQKIWDLGKKRWVFKKC